MHIRDFHQAWYIYIYILYVHIRTFNFVPYSIFRAVKPPWNQFFFRVLWFLIQGVPSCREEWGRGMVHVLTTSNWTITTRYNIPAMHGSFQWSITISVELFIATRHYALWRRFSACDTRAGHLLAQQDRGKRICLIFNMLVILQRFTSALYDIEAYRKEEMG